MIKYPTLDTLAAFIRAAGILALIIIVITGFYVGTIISVFGGLCLGLIICAPLIAFGELIQVFIDIEENTRS